MAQMFVKRGTTNRYMYVIITDDGTTVTFSDNVTIFHGQPSILSSKKGMPWKAIEAATGFGKRFWIPLS